MHKAFKHCGNHTCPVAVVHCVDFRFRKEAEEFVEKELHVEDFDLWTVPGSAKKLAEDIKGEGDLLTGLQAVSCCLHHVQKVVLINHADCGAYGGRKAFASIEVEREKHVADLHTAKDILVGKLDAVEVTLVYADLSPDGKEVTFETVG